MMLFSLILFIFAILTMNYKEKSKKRIFVESTTLFLFGLITIIYFVANYFTAEGINETVLSTLNLGLSHAGFKEYSLLILGSFFAFLLLFIMSFLHYNHLNKLSIKEPKKTKAFIHNGFFVLSLLFHPFFADIFNLYKVLSLEQSRDFYEYYKNIPQKVGTNKKNLVYIYAESFEKTYFDTSLFPNLTPNLTALIQKNGIEFTNIFQIGPAGFTLGGMVASQCAIPLFTESHGNSMSGIEKFYPKAVCISDILKNENYYLSFLKGASTKFSGADKFYKTHKFDSILGRDELVQYLNDQNYINGWGLYDDTLLDLAYDEFVRLSTEKNNFALFLLTLDTHHPNGQLSKSCADNLYLDGSNPILNTVKCSDMLLAKFIDKIQSSKFSENTIIVLASDHIAMRNTAYDILLKAKERKNLFAVFTADNKQYKEINKGGNALDIAPTILSFLGKDLDMGLGRNLLKRDSIYSLFDNFDLKLNQWRKTILSFWEFPQLGSSVDIDLELKTIKTFNDTFKIPVLIKITQENYIKPFFDFNADYKLYQLLGWSLPNDKFLWIDKCVSINYIFDTNITDQYCIAQGLYGKYPSIIGLDNVKNYKVKDFSEFIGNYNNVTAIQKKIRTLQDFKYSAILDDGIRFTQIGYPDFLDNIEGVSDFQLWGRWTDARLNKSVKITFKEPLPLNFYFEIETGTHVNNLGSTVQVKVGNCEQNFILDAISPKKYLLEFKNIGIEKTIEIIPPESKVLFPEIDADHRKLGLSLIELKIKERNEFK